MSMYLPNPDVGPIGAEPGEFIDFPLRAAEFSDDVAEARPELSSSASPGLLDDR